MEFVVRKNDLQRELQLVQGIVERKNTIPILANVLIEARDEQLYFLATDLEITLRSSCAASVTSAGVLTAPAKKFFEIVKALPDTDVHISEMPNGILVKADRFESRLQTMSKDEFPTVPEMSGAGSIDLPRARLRDMITKTQFAITGEDTRYFLNGALFELTAGAMKMVATDGHRLALVSASRQSASDEKIDAKGPILPRKTMNELAKLLAEGEGDIRFQRTENHLFFQIGDRTLISRVIDGQFPAYDKVVPKGNDKRIEFDRDRLRSAISRVQLLSNERSRSVKVQIDNGRVDITSNSPDVGEAREQIPVDFNGAGMQISFNAQYVLDFLGAVETEQVLLEVKDEVSQAVMKPLGADGYDYTYVLMPMRV